jgi:uncharacterized repeat protein (TIGR01451 family)
LLVVPSSRSTAPSAGVVPPARRRSILVVVAAVLVGMLASLGFASPAAAATTGTISEVKIVVTDDGVQPADLDGSGHNSKVAVGSAITMSWSLSAEDLVEGTLSQTLPDGWAWDTSSLLSLTSNSSVYASSYTVSGTTLTATMSVPNASIVNIPGLRAVPSSRVLDGSTYVPTVVYTDSAGSASVSATEITVVGDFQIGATVGASGSAGASGTHDFGSGAVDAYCVAIPTDIYNPATVGALSGTPDAVAATVAFTGLIPSDVTSGLCSGAADASVTISSYDATSGVLQVALDGSALGPNTDARTDVRGALSMWYPASVVTQTAQQTVIGGSFSPITVDGRPSSGAMSVQGTVLVALPGSPRPPADRYTDPSAVAATYALTATAPASYPLTWLGSSPASGWTRVATAATASGIAKDAAALPVSTLSPPYNAANLYKTQPITHIVAYDFWDPSIGQIVDADGSVELTLDGKALAADAYTVEYTSGTDADGPWAGSIAAAGGADSVRGVRISLAAIPGLSTQNTLSLSVAQKVVGDYGQRLSNNFSWAADQFDGPVPASTSVDIRFAATGVTGSADPDAIVSGNAIAYTAVPTACATKGGTTTLTGTDLELKITFASVVTSVDYSAAIAAGWQLSSLTPADLGPDGLPGTIDDVRGPVLVLSIAEVSLPPNGCATVPPAGVSVATSLRAPAIGTTIPASLSVTMDQATSSILSLPVRVAQSNTLSMDGSVTTPLLQPSDNAAQWTTNWYNFTSSTVTGGAYIVDVLPHNGDARGTSTTASLTLTGATLLGQAATNGSELQYTTTDPAEIGPVPGDGASWQPVTATTDLTGATALRVYLPTMLSGSFGGLRVTMSVSGQTTGDVISNGAEASFVTNSTVLTSPSYTARVIGAGVSGSIWRDLAASGHYDESDPGIVAAKVTLLRDGTPVATTAADDSGAYSFENLDGGEYTVVVDPSSLGGANVRQTFGPQSALDNTSGTLPVGPGQTLTGVDFGYAVTSPAISLTKTADVADDAAGAAGDRVDYVFTVTNTGDTRLDDVRVDDPMTGLSALTFGDWPSGTLGTLLPAQSVTATAHYAIRQADVDAGALVNTATATASVSDGSSVSDSAAATVTLARASALSLSKTGALSTAGTGAVGDAVNFAFTVVNTGTTTLTDVTVSDELAGLTALRYGTWPTGTAGTLEPGQSITATASLILTQDDIDAGAIVNTAAARGTGPAETVNAVDTSTVLVPQHAAIALTETGRLADGDATAAPGSSVIFDYVVTNTGNATLTISDLGDEIGHLSALQEKTGLDTVLAPGASVTFHGAYSLAQADIDAGAVIDVSRVVAHTASNEKVAAEASATVAVPGVPSIRIEHTGTLDSDASGVAGDHVRFDYTVTNTGDTTLTSVGLGDDLAGLTGLTFGPWPSGTDGRLAPGESVVATADYLLTQRDVDAGTVISTASVKAVRVGGDASTVTDTATATVGLPRHGVGADTGTDNGSQEGSPGDPPARSRPWSALAHTGSDLLPALAAVVILLGLGGVSLAFSARARRGGQS